MEVVKIEKKKLLERLKTNREKHKEIYAEAKEGYREEAVKRFKSELKKAKKGDDFRASLGILQPVSNLKDYDKIIAMVDIHCEDTIELNSHEFSQYMLDDWVWKDNFVMSNSRYLKSGK